jgi:hypothetical protein
VSQAALGLLAALMGIVVGTLWELSEFVVDWIGLADLQPSNTDTMTDLLATNVAAVLGAVVALNVYRHVLGPARRDWLGTLGSRVADTSSDVLERHGRLVTLAVLGVITVVLAGLWFTDRAARLTIG